MRWILYTVWVYTLQTTQYLYIHTNNNNNNKSAWRFLSFNVVESFNLKNRARHVAMSQRSQFLIHIQENVLELVVKVT